MIKIFHKIQRQTVPQRSRTLRSRATGPSATKEQAFSDEGAGPSATKEQDPQQSGFTLAELMISVTVLALIIGFAASIYINFFQSFRDVKASNLVYEESRYAMNRIVKEIRNGTVDYEEYYNQAGIPDDLAVNTTFGRNYCSYSLQFYDAGPDGIPDTSDDENVGRRKETSPPAIGRFSLSGAGYEADPIQNQLFLIDVNGTERTYIKRIEKDDGLGNTIGKIGLLKLVGRDYGIDHLPSGEGEPPCSLDPGEQDGRIDTWVCDEAAGFTCEKEEVFGFNSCVGERDRITEDKLAPAFNSFIDITPEALDIVDLKFIIAPMDDPRKAYNNDEMQIQPHVTVRLVARAAPKLSIESRSERRPGITLESTLSTRAQNEIISECNRKQCTSDIESRACVKNQGILKYATQTCTNYTWPGCTDAQYEAFAASFCADQQGECIDLCAGDSACITTCGAEKIDCDSKYLTYNPGGSMFILGQSYPDIDLGPYDPLGEIGSCDLIPNPPDRESCKIQRCEDRLDNDGVNGLVDNDDPQCKEYLCNNGKLNDGEACIDVGDVGSACYVRRPLESKEVTCFDGYDNDCDGQADEFDEDCAELVCSNIVWDNVVENTAETANAFIDDTFYNTGSIEVNGKVYDPSYFIRSDVIVAENPLNETCTDVGGICEQVGHGAPGPDAKETDVCNSLPAEERLDCTRRVCSDGLDNDCDGFADEFDGSDTPDDEADDDCVPVICSNPRQDCDLVPNLSPEDLQEGLFGVTSYANLTGYQDGDSPACTDVFTSSRNDEYCRNVGGICDDFNDLVTIPSYGNEVGDTRIIGRYHQYLFGDYNEGNPPDLSPSNPNDAVFTCNDGLDNDCDGKIDWEDNQCCPDTDGDSLDSDGDGIIDIFFLEQTEVCRLQPKPDNIFFDCNNYDKAIFPDDPNDFGEEDDEGVPNFINQEHCNADNLTYPVVDGCEEGQLCEFPTDFEDPYYVYVLDSNGDPTPERKVFPASLQGQPIDDNCSALNGWTDDGLDTNDPACCVDLDGDGYGVKGWHASCQGPNGAWDCNDTDPAINPAITNFENTPERCFDGEEFPVNENCNRSTITYSEGITTSVPRANHIDWYKDKNMTWLENYAAADNEDFDISGISSWEGIKTAYELKLFEPACCDPTAIEICDDAEDSDENCTGFEGTEDHFCIAENGLSFLDNFTRGDYLAVTEGVEKDEDGTFTVLNTDPGSPGTVTSGPVPLDKDTCTKVGSATIVPSLLVPGNTQITFQVSNDGGSTWCGDDACNGVDTMTADEVSGGENSASFPTVGNDLIWKAVLTGDDADSPELDSMTINFTCNS